MGILCRNGFQQYILRETAKQTRVRALSLELGACYVAVLVASRARYRVVFK